MNILTFWLPLLLSFEGTIHLREPSALLIKSRLVGENQSVNSGTRLIAILVLALISFASPSPAAPYNVYVADPSVGAIYALSTATPGELPRIVSANATIAHRDLKFLSTTQAAFTTFSADSSSANRFPQNLLIYDLPSGAMTEIFRARPEEWIISFDTGPGPNEISIITSLFSRYYLVRGTRETYVGAWTFTYTNHPTSRVLRPEFLHVGGNRYALTLANSDLVLEDAMTGDMITLESGFLVDGRRLIRGPGNQWMSFADFYPNDYIRVYDFDGILLRGGTPDLTATVFGEPFTAVEWQGNPPNFSAVGRTGLNSGSDPSLPPPATVSRELLFLDESLHRNPKTDLSGGEAVVTETPTRRLVSSQARGGVFTVDSGATEIVPHYAVQRGSGPPFRTILDLLVGKDGYLYILDKHDFNSDYHILRVDPVLGTREIVAELNDMNLDPSFGQDSQGRFIVGLDPRTTGDPRFFLGIVDPDFNPNAVTLVAQALYPLLPSDVAYGSDGSATLLFPQSGPYLLMARDGLAFNPILYDEFSTTSLQATFENSQWKYRGNIVVPPGTPPADSLILYGTFAEPVRGVKLTSPNSATFTVRTGFRSLVRKFPTLDPESPVDPRFGIVNLGQVTDLAGTWQFELLFEGSPPPPPLQFTRMTLVPRPSPRSQLIATASGGQPVLFETRPSALAVGIPTAHSFYRIPLVPAPNSNIDVGSFNLMSDLKFTPDFTTAYLADQETPRVVQINVANGQTTPFMTGRPPILSGPGIDQSVSSALKIAIGPDLPLDQPAKDSGWMLRSR